MILVVLIILLFILLRWYTNNFERYETEYGTDSYGVQVTPVETLNIKYFYEHNDSWSDTAHLRFNSDKQAWDLHRGSSDDYTTSGWRSYESVLNPKVKNGVASYHFKENLVSISQDAYRKIYEAEMNGIIKLRIGYTTPGTDWVHWYEVPVNDLYIPIDPPTFDTSVSNTGLDVTVSFSNVKKTNPKYTISIHDENDDEITSYTFSKNRETFNLNWKENSPGTKKYTVKLNGRIHSNHEITIEGDDSGGIYKINKINFKWHNTNGVNESVDKWVIVVKKDGYAPFETINIPKDSSNFFNNFTDTPTVELLKGYAFKDLNEITGIKIYLYYIHKNGIKKLLSTSDPLDLNEQDFNRDITNFFDSLGKDTFISRDWDTDIYNDHNKDCDAKFVEDGNEYSCDKNADGTTGDYTCQKWRYNISVKGIGEGTECIKDKDEIITVNWPSVNTLTNYSTFTEIEDDKKNPNENSDLVNTPLTFANAFETHRAQDEHNIDCKGSWIKDGDLTEDCDDKDYLMCQDWKYNVTQERTGTGTACEGNQDQTLTVKYPSSDAMTLYLPPDDIVKWETVDDLNPNKTGALIGSSDMYVKPFEDYKTSKGDDFTPIETRIRKELKIKVSDIVRLTSSQASATSLGNSVVTNGKWSLAGQPYNCSSCYGSVHLYNNDRNFNRTIVGSTHPDWSKSFGSSVAMSDKHVIMSAYKQSKVYLYDIDDRGLSEAIEIDGGDAIREGAVKNTYHFPVSLFGRAIAISDDYIVVTAPQQYADIADTNYRTTITYRGVIYIYEKDQLGNWKIEKTDRKEITDNYSDIITVSGDTIAMGVNNNVHIYERDSEGEWVISQTLEGTGSFGQSISISGDYMLIGAPGVNEVYMYEKTGGNDGWVQMGDAITREGAGQWTSFGRAVSLSNDYAIIGEDSGRSKGAVTIYKRIYGRLDMGTQVFAPDRQDGAGFGNSVAVSNKYAIIGAPGEEISTNVTVGAVYIIDLSNIEHADIEIQEEEEGATVQYVWVGFESDYEHNLVLNKIQVMSGDEDIVAGIGDDEGYGGVTTSGVNTSLSMLNGSIDVSNPEKIPFLSGGSATNTFYVGNKATSSWIKMKLKKKYKVSDIDKVVVWNSTKYHRFDWYQQQWAGTFVKLLDSEDNEIRRSHEMVHPDNRITRMWMQSPFESEKYKFKNFYFPNKDVVKYIWVGYEDNDDDDKLILSDIRVFVDNKNILKDFGGPYAKHDIRIIVPDKIETSGVDWEFDDTNTPNIYWGSTELSPKNKQYDLGSKIVYKYKSDTNRTISFKDGVWEVENTSISPQTKLDYNTKTGYVQVGNESNNTAYGVFKSPWFYNFYPTKEDKIETSSFEKAQDEYTTYTKDSIKLKANRTYAEKTLSRDLLKAEHILFDGNLRIQKIDSKVTNYYMTEGASTNWIKINLGDNYVNYEDIQKVVVYTHSQDQDTKANWRGTFVKLLNTESIEIAKSSDTVPTNALDARRYKERDVQNKAGQYVIQSSTSINAYGDRRKTFTNFDKTIT